MASLISTFVLLLLVISPLCAQAPQTIVHKLKATPKTIVWGHYSASTPAVLRIQSGDTVEMETIITNSPARLEAAGVAPGQIEQSLRDIYEQVKDRGPGGHILT